MFSINLRHPGIGSLAFMLRYTEPALVILLSGIAYAIRMGAVGTFEEGTAPLALTVLAAALYSMGASTLRLYDPNVLRLLLTNLPRIIAAVTISFMIVLILLFMFKISAQFSRVWLASWYVMTLVGLIGCRWWAMNVISTRVREGRWTRKVAILGTNAKAMELVHLIRDNNDIDLSLIGIYSFDGGDGIRAPQKVRLSEDMEELYCGDFAKLLAHGHQMLLDDVIITEDLENLSVTDAMLNKLQTMAVNVMYCLPLSLVSRVGIGGLPLVMVFKKPMEGHSLVLKRALDIIASAGIITCFAPVIGVIALLVKMSSPGPVFFRQSRGGFNGKAFEMLKFRSMRVGAAAVLDDNGKEAQATRDDPRITWIGKIIRKTSLDELPQLLNVLRGDMSLVGPRPHVPSHNSYYENLIDTYASRHKMKPGLTGWAQLNGWRGETETLEKMAKRVEFDIWYTENWSFWLDIKIIFLTPFVTVFQRTAY